MTTEVMKAFLSNLGVGRTPWHHWQDASEADLDSALRKLRAHGSEAWPWIADWRHFDQFATPADRAAQAALTAREYVALCGHWEEPD